MEDILIEAAIPVLIADEGERLHVYTDSLGIPTIGVGLALMQRGSDGKLINSTYAQNICAKLGLNFDGLLNGKVNLTQEQSRAILAQCLADTTKWLPQVLPSFWTYSQPRQIAILDMGFALGEAKFRRFTEMIQCILKEDWDGASREALDSKWAREVGLRANRDAERMRRG